MRRTPSRPPFGPTSWFAARFNTHAADWDTECEKVGRLELPLPELGEGAIGLSSAAKDLEDRIVAQVPEEFRGSIRVRPFKEGERTGIAVEYDDRAESFVFASLEYPRGGGRSERIVP